MYKYDFFHFIRSLIRYFDFFEMRFKRVQKCRRMEQVIPLKDDELTETNTTKSDLIDLTDHEEKSILLGDSLLIEERIVLHNLQKMLNAMNKNGMRTCMIKHVSRYSTFDAYSLQPRHFCNILQKFWIDDTVVDAYLLLLRDYMSARQTHNLAMLNTHIFVLMRNANLENKDPPTGLSQLFRPNIRYYFSPVLVNENHWISVLLDVVSNHVYVYDSFQTCESKYTSYLRPSIQAMIRLHNKKLFVKNVDEYATITTIRGMPRQKNTYDCGIYMLAYARALRDVASGTALNLGQDVERYGRRKLALSLHACFVN
eukprot:gene16448-19526_t